MTTADLLLAALGAIAVGAGALVVSSKRVVRAGLWLVVTLGAVAGLYLVLTAELVAWVQVLLYVGAIVVLLLFVVMLTKAPTGASDDLDRVRWPGVLVGAGAAASLVALFANAYRWTRISLPGTDGANQVTLSGVGNGPLPQPGTAEHLGEQVFRSWVLPFELVGLLLLAALVGAIVISRPGRR